MPRSARFRPFLLVIAGISAACAQPDPRASAAPPPSVAIPPAKTPPSAAPPADGSIIAPVAPPKRAACGATHVVLAGETLATIATACYGARAYDDLLRRKNALEGSTLAIGQSLATPPLRDLARCAPAEVCEPIYTAHAAFLEAQALTEHAKIAPPSAQPHLDEATRSLGSALGAAEAKKITSPKSQLKAALGEIASLRAGSCGEPGYCEATFHQHLVYAIEALGKGR